MYEILQGNNLNLLRELQDNSIDAIVTDPPYGLAKIKAKTVQEVLSSWLKGEEAHVKGRGFMGAQWDSFVPSPTLWRECLRVLKPGGHMAVFAGSRTVDLMGLSLRLAGAEIRDTLGLLGWVYGSGFPKSLNVSKEYSDSDLSAQWDGWGTALKPSYEPILLCRKEPQGTIAHNVETFGTGGLHIDACRLDSCGTPSSSARGGIWKTDADAKGTLGQNDLGRWPPNTIFLHHPLCVEESCHSSCVVVQMEDKAKFFPQFFYSSKASRRERERGCEDLPTRTSAELTGRKEGSAGLNNPRASTTSNRKNHHPTVKPLDLMRWLCRLVTPPNGVILDPFAGSGSTIVASQLEGFDGLGFELNPEYVTIGRSRCEAWSKGETDGDL